MYSGLFFIVSFSDQPASAVSVSSFKVTGLRWLNRESTWLQVRYCPTLVISCKRRRDLKSAFRYQMGSQTVVLRGAHVEKYGDQ